jgi:hypothetical protein
MHSAHIVAGTLTATQTVTLDEALPLTPAKVRVVIEPLLSVSPRQYQEDIAKIRERQRTRGHQPSTREEIDAHLQVERDSWGRDCTVVSGCCAYYLYGQTGRTLRRCNGCTAIDYRPLESLVPSRQNWDPCWNTSKQRNGDLLRCAGTHVRSLWHSTESQREFDAHIAEQMARGGLGAGG